MREILFRGKRVDNGEWVFGYYTKKKTGDWHMDKYIEKIVDCIIVGFSAGGVGHVVVDPATVGQSTGLSDSNGMRIFEGDIVKAEIIKNEWSPLTIAYGAVFYEESSFRVPTGLHPGDWVRLDDLSHDVSVVVVGNVSENPELLETEGKK